MTERDNLIHNIKYWANLATRAAAVPELAQFDGPTLRWIIEMAYKYGEV